MSGRYRPCPVDGTPVDQHTERRGRPATYCSPACRQKAFRLRRKAEGAAVVAEAEALTRAAADVPAELRRRARWVRWDLIRGRKLPLRADMNRAASSTDPRTWTDYDTARASAVGRGLGFVLGDGVGCIDLDHCIAPDGSLSALAQETLRLNPDAWVERSQSGTGLHVWGLRPEGPGRRRKQIEVYSVGRYIALGETYRPGALAPLVVPGQSSTPSGR